MHATGERGAGWGSRVAGPTYQQFQVMTLILLERDESMVCLGARLRPDRTS